LRLPVTVPIVSAVSFFGCGCISFVAVHTHWISAD